MADLATVKTASPLTVTLDTSETALPAKHLDSYVPAVDDQVLVAQTHSGPVIYGKVVP